MSKSKKEKAYYLTLFKIEGHKTWRAHLAAGAKQFDEERSRWVKSPKITDRSTLRIDRITKEIDIK